MLFNALQIGINCILLLIRYAEFLQDLGTLISLEDAESMGLFLDTEKGGRDGRFAYVWQDDIMQVRKYHL